MKIRNGFVSNSSSSSFIIRKDDLTPSQIDKIYNHIDVDAEEFNSQYGIPRDSEYSELNFKWTIAERGDDLTGEVMMDNFDMEGFLEAIGVNIDKIEWKEFLV